MKNIILMLDSSGTAGWTKAESEAKGLLWVPFVLTIDGVDKKPGLDITTQELYDYLAKNTQAKITTSQVSPADLTDTFREGLKRAKHVLYIPISQGLSSTMSTAIAIARQDEFKGKVTVYQSNFITPWLKSIWNQIIDLVDNSEDVKTVTDFLDISNDKMYGWIAPKDLDRLYASGRIKKVQYIMGKLMKVYPIVPVINGSVNDTGTVKARGVEAATKKVAELVDAKQKEIEAEGYETVVWYVDDFNLGLKEAIEATGIKPLKMNVGAEIIAHLGAGSWGSGVQIIKKK